SNCNGVTEHQPQVTHSYSRTGSNPAPPLTGCTTVTAPGGGISRVYWDNLGNTREVDSPLETSPSNKNYVLYFYDNFNTREWSEDEHGNATDNTYSTDTHLLPQTQSPDPQMTGLGRPTTTYRYDETAIGTATANGPALTGLQARYYSSTDFSTTPAGVEN